VLRNTGIDRLVLVNPGDWDRPEARWLAHGSEAVLDRALVVPDLATAVADAHLVVGTTHRTGKQREVDAHPRETLTEVARVALTHQVALVFGREKDGLWHDELALCHQLVRFPSAVEHPSFNLSHAVLLCTYELFHASQGARPRPHRHLATAADREEFYRHLLAALTAIEFRPFNDDPRNFSRALRRVFNRIDLDDRDLRLLHRLCGQVTKFAERHVPLTALPPDTPTPSADA
jgi:TrmH family RNA methyltransferase